MILSAQTIRRRVTGERGTGRLLVIDPFCERTVIHGMSYGLSVAGYDLRIKDGIALAPGQFALVTSVERLEFPADVMGRLNDKSTWARRGLAVQNTIFEPGWRGYPTIELSNHGPHWLSIWSGAPIAQMTFELVDQPVERPYAGKYQDQEQRPVEALEERNG